METILKLFLIALSCNLSAALKNNRYYPRYHLAPVKGWMNNPNGFCHFRGEYHLFYQYNPESSLEPGTTCLAHVKSKDFFNWMDLGIAVHNDTNYDKNGVFGGSVVVDSDVMYLFYTGHVKHPHQISEYNQGLAFSKDGIHVTKFKSNLVLMGKDFQQELRNPKVWQYENSWYMVLGNSFDRNGEKFGRVLMFKSSDKVNWTQVSVLIESDGFLGYKWEYPDFFEIDGHFVLIFSARGIKRHGDKFKNLYQTGYIVGDFDYNYNVFTPETEFRELDFGHDFYGTQTILDKYGRRLLVGWMDTINSSYPEKQDGFTGQMTIVRRLSLTKNYRLIQKPVQESISARAKEVFLGHSYRGITIGLSDKAAEVHVMAPRTKDFNLYIGTDTSSVHINYDFNNGFVSLKRDDSDDGLRRTNYRPLTKFIMRVFIDASSIEVFFGAGEVTISSRFFVDGPINVYVDETSTADLLRIFEIKTTFIQQ